MAAVTTTAAAAWTECTKNCRNFSGVAKPRIAPGFCRFYRGFSKKWVQDVVFLWTECGETAGKDGVENAFS